MSAPSLRGRLRWLISLAMAVVLVPLGLFSLLHTVAEVNELADGRLASDARTLQLLIHSAGFDSLDADDGGMLVVPAGPASDRSETHEDEVGFQVVDAHGAVRLATSNFSRALVLQDDGEGFSNVQIGRHRWRVFTVHDAARHAVIHVGERDDSRRDIIRTQWDEHAVPLLLGVPLLALLVGWAVKRGLRPLSQLARLLAERQPGSRGRAPIVLADPPQELQPLLAALNEQLQGLEDAIERERRFSADVAHELRTPLASTLINIEHAIDTPDATGHRQALEGARHAVEALTRRVQQLLALSRLEAGSGGEPAAVEIDLVAIAVGIIEELESLPDPRRVELGFSTPAPRLMLRGHEAALSALLRNLLENALRHVPDQDGQVQLTLAGDTREVIVDVLDNGPGIPPDQRERVLRRFHRETSARGEGYGLGLSIVTRAVRLHGGTLQLLDAPSGRGLLVRVCLPLAPAAEPLMPT